MLLYCDNCKKKSQSMKRKIHSKNTTLIQMSVGQPPPPPDKNPMDKRSLGQKPHWIKAP